MLLPIVIIIWNFTSIENQPKVPNILKQSLDLLKLTVDTYNGNSIEVVEISNIATLNDGDEFLESASPIILSVINIEEDSLARIPQVYLPNPNRDNPAKKYNNPTQHFITSILFTAYTKVKSNGSYLDGINKLEHVIRCFQEQRVFMLNGTTKLILDLESLKINELNQLWSMLGNKYMPSVLYRMRVISIQHDEKDGAGLIEEFKIKLWENDSEDSTGLLEETDYITKQL